MKLKEKIIISFLLAMAVILTQSVPSINSIPDFNTIILIIIILMNPKYKRMLIYGLFIGILSAIMAKSPNSQISNIICKIVTVNITYLIITLHNKIKVKQFLNVIFFIVLFTNNAIYLAINFFINGFSGYDPTIILDISLLILFSSIINTKIGCLTLNLINKCIYYDTVHNE